MVKKRKGNPFALCNWLAKKHHKSAAWKEKCIRNTKKKMHRRGRHK